MKKTGSIVTALIVAGVVGILFFNLEGDKPASPAAPKSSALKPPPPPSMTVREHPIGDEVSKNHVRVAAVWLSAVAMDGMTSAGPNPIHIEADVKADENNPNGYAKDDTVAYLKITYAVEPAGGGDPIAKGELVPMMARDGFHYGATIAMPPPGEYRLLYDIQPPSANNVGRHSDPATGVAPWWEPFRAAFDWAIEPGDVPGPALAGSR